MTISLVLVIKLKTQFLVNDPLVHLLFFITAVFSKQSTIYNDFITLTILILKKYLDCNKLLVIYH